VTTLAPPPGRQAEPDDEGDDGPGDDDLAVLPDTPSVFPSAGPATDIDLTIHHAAPRSADPAAQASWVFGLALALVTEGENDQAVMTEVLAVAAGRSRAIEGAYGRAVALLSEFPGDPLVHRTVDLLAKALLRSRRPARAEEA
jgi:hypothetical protein